MTVLLNAVTTDTASSGQSLSGPATVYTSGTFDGASVEIQVAPSDTAAKYVPAGRDAVLLQPGVISIDVLGAYYLKAVSKGSGASTAITAEVVQ